METGAVSKTLKYYSHDEKVKNRAGDGLNLNFWEDSEWADPVPEKSWEDSQCADGVRDNLWKDSQLADEVSQNLWELCEWADEVSEGLWKDSKCGEEVSENLCNLDFQDHKLKIPKGEEVKQALPEELVEKILAMVPFPFVFKARVLSKSWLARLSSVSSQDDEQKKHLAISFQKQIREQSVKWKIFCPVVSRTYCPSCNGCLSRTVINAYDRTSHSCLTLPSLSVLLKNLREPDTFLAHVEQIEGPLLLLSMESFTSNVECKQLYVVNILTRDWKELPPSPHSQALRWKTFLSITSEKYELIIYGPGLVDIYDSTAAAWTSVELPPTLSDMFLGGVLYLDGVLYILKLPSDDPFFGFSTVPSLKVLAVKVNEETSAEDVNIVAETTDMRLPETRQNISNVHMVFCTVNLLIIIVEMFKDGFFDEILDDFLIFKIDLQSRQVSVVATSPPNKAWLGWDRQVVTDGDCILIAVDETDGDQALDGACVLAYDVQKDEWASHPYRARLDQATILPNLWGYYREENRRSCYEHQISSSFRPGLNPFVAV